MKDEITKKKASLVEFSQAIGAVLGAPIILFTIINNIFQQPMVSLAIAIITGIGLTLWLAYSSKMNISYLAIAWLSLLVIILLGFVVWPNTMTIEGFVHDTNGQPVVKETVKFFDYRGQVYETLTDQNGFFQFEDVLTGKYRIRVRTTEIQGESKGLLVRVISQSISVPSEVVVTQVSTPMIITTPTKAPQNIYTPPSMQNSDVILEAALNTAMVKPDVAFAVLPLQASTNRAPSLIDDFSNPTSGFGEIHLDAGDTYYSNGIYLLENHPIECCVNSNVIGNYTDSVLQIDISIDAFEREFPTLGALTFRRSVGGWYSFHLNYEGSVMDFSVGHHLRQRDYVELSRNPLPDGLDTTVGSWHNVIVVVVKNQMAYFVDGILVTNITDDNLTQGGIGFFAGWGTTMRADNLRIWDVSDIN